MSSGLSVYAVSIDQLKRVLGSRDSRWIKAVQENAAGLIESVDDVQTPDEGEESHTCGEAVAHLINGETSDALPGSLYGFALEAICSEVGEFAGDVCPINRVSGFVEWLDEGLAAHGVPVRMEKLIFGTDPVPLPDRDENPLIGWWSPEECAAAAAAFRDLDLATAEADSELRESLEQVREWVQQAAATPGVSIIGFLA